MVFHKDNFMDDEYPPFPSDIPTTEEEIAYDVFYDLDEEEKEYLRKQSEGSLIQFHHTAGRGIRNDYHLWHPDHPHTETGKDVRDGVDYTYNHPDSYSSRITHLVWCLCREEEL